MFGKKRDPFLNVVKYGFAGSTAGFLNGLGLALLINWLIVSLLSGEAHVSADPEFVLFLSMGMGALVGGIAGVIHGLRK